MNHESFKPMNFQYKQGFFKVEISPVVPKHMNQHGTSLNIGQIQIIKRNVVHTNV